MPVLVAAAAAGLVVLAAYAGLGVLTLAVVGVQILLAYGLTGARDLPGRTGSATLIALTGIGSVVALRLADPEPSGPTVEPVLWVLGPAVVVALLLELGRRDGRAHLAQSLATTVTGIAFVGMLSLLVPLESLDPLAEVGVVFAAAGAVLGAAVWWLCAAGAGRWRWLGTLGAALVVAGAAVALATAAVPELTSTEQIAIGSAVAVTGLVGAGAAHQLAGAVLSRAALMPALAMAMTAPGAYLAQRLLFW